MLIQKRFYENKAYILKQKFSEEYTILHYLKSLRYLAN